MSIANDLRSYADSALEQGRQVVDQAQSRFSDVQGNAQDITGKAAGKATATYADLRTKGETLYGRVSTLPGVEQVTATVEPYVAQLNGYRVVVAEKVEQAYTDLKKNDQVAKVLGVAETAAGVVIETVNERVVTPVKSLLDHESETATKAPAAFDTVPAEAPEPAAASAAASAPVEAPVKAPVKAPAKPTSAAKATPVKRTTTPRTPKA
jgi:hypothetical protein